MTNSNGQAPGLRPPVVLWAQREDKIFLTVELQDCKEPTIKLDKDKLYFKGKSDSIVKDADKSEHEVTVDFCEPINVEQSKHTTTARGTEFVIAKEEPKWWPRLLKDSTKRHWLKVDFLKWKDEDDSDDERGMPGMGGMPGGMPGMGGQDFGDLMQQFGGGNFGGMGDMGADDDEEPESDDDDTEKPPELIEG